MKHKRLLFIGNFEPPFSTENDLKWTFEKLGWEVTEVQENGPGPWPAYIGNYDLMLYVHTHGWGNPGHEQTLIDEFKRAQIPTASFHLDRFWGLDVLDRREARIGQHPFWKTDYVFTADGGNQDGFKAKGVNHHWLKPGVIERDCYLGEKRPEYEVDVAFVGSKSYHPEHKHRGQLIEWLERAYNGRFARFAGDTSYGTVRGKDLNDVYASTKVTIGDHCFSTKRVNNYCSDRYYEAPGRGGFLLYPKAEGLDNPFVPTYEPDNYLELQEKIDWFLHAESERERMRKQAHEWVKENATYTVRVKEMLKIMEI